MNLATLFFLVTEFLYLLALRYFIKGMAGFKTTYEGSFDLSLAGNQHSLEHLKPKLGKAVRIDDIKRHEKTFRFASLTTVVALCMHSFLVFLPVIRDSHCPIQGIYFTLNVASIATVCVFLVTRRKMPIDGVGTILLPFAMVALLTSQLALKKEWAMTPVKSAVLPFHIFFSTLGVALFALAGAFALLFLIQDRRLKKKKSRPSSKSLSLESLDKMTFRFLLMGFPLLTLAVLTGAFWIHDNGDNASLLRSIFGYCIWIFTALLLFSRIALGWRGKKAAIGTLLGFATVCAILSTYIYKSTKSYDTKNGAGVSFILPSHSTVTMRSFHVQEGHKA